MITNKIYFWLGNSTGDTTTNWIWTRCSSHSVAILCYRYQFWNIFSTFPLSCLIKKSEWEIKMNSRFQPGSKWETDSIPRTDCYLLLLDKSPDTDSNPNGGHSLLMPYLDKAGGRQRNGCLLAVGIDSFWTFHDWIPWIISLIGLCTWIYEEIKG